MRMWFQRLFCRHQFRASKRWLGVKVCEKCGRRAVGET